MNQSTLITVYITTKDRSQLLKRAIDSVYSQSYRNFEVIVCNDASQDSTEELLNYYQAKYDNFSFYSTSSTQGACVHRNIAISKAKGKFITGLDDDDFFLPKRLEVFMEHYDKKYAFLCSSYLRNSAKERLFLKDASGEISLNKLLHYNRIGNQVFIETKRLKALGGFDENLPAFQDYDMWVRMLKQFGSGVKILDPLYVFDISHASERISASPRVQEGYKLFLAKHKVLMNNSHLDSMELLSTSINKNNLSIIDAIRLCNRGNYKSVINSFFKRN